MTGIRRPATPENPDRSNPTPQRRRRRRMAAAGVLLLIVVVVAANFVAGQLIEAKVAHAAQLRLHGSSPNVDLNGTPALVDLVTGQVPTVQIQSNNASLCRFNGLVVTANLTNVSDSNSELSIGASQATVTIGTAALSQVLSGQLKSAKITPDPAHDQLDVGAALGGLVQAQVHPVLHADTLSIELVGVSLFGQAAPRGLVDTLRRRVHFSLRLTHLPMALHPTAVTVTRSGIQIALSGGSWQGSNTVSSTTSGTC